MCMFVLEFKCISECVCVHASLCNPLTYILKTELLWAFNTMHVYALELALVYLHTKVHQVFAG